MFKFKYFIILLLAFLLIYLIQNLIAFYCLKKHCILIKIILINYYLFYLTKIMVKSR